MSALHKMASDAESVEHEQYLTFVLGTEVFAIGILAIKEIIEYGHLTEVPMAPACIRGVINLRGAVVPVMDLAVRLGRSRNEVAKRTCIVIVEAVRDGQREEMGIVVDAVNAVLDIPAADIEPPPRFGTNVNAAFIHGLGKVDGRFVILLDTATVLTVEEAGARASNTALVTDAA